LGEFTGVLATSRRAKRVFTVYRNNCDMDIYRAIFISENIRELVKAHFSNKSLLISYKHDYTIRKYFASLILLSKYAHLARCVVMKKFISV
jgi:hypothetical protein